MNFFTDNRGGRHALLLLLLREHLPHDLDECSEMWKIFFLAYIVTSLNTCLRCILLGASSCDHLQGVVGFNFMRQHGLARNCGCLSAMRPPGDAWLAAQWKGLMRFLPLGRRRADPELAKSSWETNDNVTRSKGCHFSLAGPHGPNFEMLGFGKVKITGTNPRIARRRPLCDLDIMMRNHACSEESRVEPHLGNTLQPTPCPNV
jgi:hypothetical protein